MSTGKKAGISLIITLLIFAIFAVFSFARLFGTFETKFYQPAVISGMEKHLKEVSACLDEYTLNQASKFATYSNLYWVKNSSSYTQTEDDIQKREENAISLMEEISGLQGIRIIDSIGKKIIYSTFKNDTSNYTENLELPYENIKSNQEIENRNKGKIIFDNTKERIIYSFPFYDNYDIYRGSIVFYVAGSDFNNYLISKNILSFSEKATLVATVFSNSTEQSKGFVLGLPTVSAEAIISKIVDLWNKDSFETQKVLHSEEYNWFVVSDNSGKTGIISLVFKDDILVFSSELKILLLLCAFITLYLIVLLIFNIKQDDQAIIKDKIKRFKVALINEYLNNSDDVNWDEVSKFLAIRKYQINNDIRYYLGKKAKTHKVLVDNLLEKTWEDVEKIIINHEKVDSYENANKSKSDNSENVEYLQEIENVTNIPKNSEYIPELYEEPEEVEYLDDSKKTYNDWGEESLNSTEENKNSVLTYRFNKDNTASVNDFNFEFSRPDFAELDNTLEEEFNKIDEEVDEIEELEEISGELEEICEVAEVEQVEEIQQIEEIEQIIEVEETEELLEESTCEQELEEEIETFEEVSEVTEELEEIFDEVTDNQEVEEVIEDFEEIEDIAEVLEEVEEIYEEQPNDEDFGSFSEDEELEETEQVEENIDELEEIEELEELEEIEEVFEVAELTETEEFSNNDEEIVTVEKISSLEEQNLSESEIPEAELEELNYVEVFSLTSGFNAKIFTSEKIEELYPVDEESPIIETESGIFVISNNIDSKNLSLDQNFQNLVDSVLQNTI